MTYEWNDFKNECGDENEIWLDDSTSSKEM